MSELLKRFLEQSNIRWGELIGGLLIVGCSIALVITFREAIARQPLLKYFLFTGITSALFGVGLYTEHHWRLRTTSRGILLTATLLAPLALLAITGVSAEGAGGGVMMLVGEIAACGVFAWLLWMSGKVIAPQWVLPWVSGVLGASASQILMARLASGHGTSTAMLLLLASWPLACYCASNGWATWKSSKAEEIDSSGAYRLLMLLGVTSFAMLVSMGMLASRMEDWISAARRMAPLLSLAGVPALAGGLLMWRRLLAKELASVRTSWTAVAVAGSLVMLGCIALAWPNPAGMVPVALIDFVVLSAIALFIGFPAAHGLALPCLGFAYLLLCHLLLPAEHTDHLKWTEQPERVMAAMVSATAGPALLGLAMILGLGAGGLMKWTRKVDAVFYGAGAAVAAALSLLLVSAHGLGRMDDHGAAWVYTIYAVAALAGACVSRKSVILAAASGLLGLALVQWIVFKTTGWMTFPNRGALAMLVHASVMVAWRIIAIRRVRAEASGSESGEFLRTLLRAGSLASMLGAALITGGLFTSDGMPPFAVPAWMMLWLAALWLAMGHMSGLGIALYAGQSAIFIASAFLATALAQRRTWFTNAEFPLAHPWALQAQGIAVASVCGLWMVLRRMIRAKTTGPLAVARELIDMGGRDVERIARYAVVGLVAILAVWAVTPGIIHELAPAEIITSVPSHSAEAMGIGSWLLIIASLGLLLGGIREKLEAAPMDCVILMLAMACALGAARFDGHNSAASALRWLDAILLLAGSAVFWGRRRISIFADAGLVARLRSALLVLTVTPLLVLTLYPAIKTLMGETLAGPKVGSMFAARGSSLNYLPPLAILIASGGR
jgi:hypothetical protein